MEDRGHVCPWWIIRTFDNPFRRLIHDPTRILAGVVHEGDRCLDVGCGIGYFTIPMARLAGPSGRVTAVDLQPRMLEGVRRRAEQAGLSARICLHHADASGVRPEGTFDFALVFWMAHEVPDQAALFDQIRAVLKPDGRLLLVEPRGHVGKAAFERTLAAAMAAGFANPRQVHVRFSRAVLMGGR